MATRRTGEVEPTLVAFTLEEAVDGLARYAHEHDLITTEEFNGGIRLKVGGMYVEAGPVSLVLATEPALGEP